MDQLKYRVEFDKFTERHYVKKFKKKYQTAWTRTESDIIFVCEHIQNMLLTKRADLIKLAYEYKLIKLDFAIFGIKVSPKAAGNRCILVVNEKTRVVKVLLVYAKTDISARNETQEWQKMIKQHFPEVGKIFSL